MSNDDLVLLSRIYNTLAQIETKGDGTLRMAQCLNALQDFISNHQQEVSEQDG